MSDIKGKLPCPFPWSYAMVMPDGHVKPCCYNDRSMGDVACLSP
ncbi:MAG: SPASM domain-containing protein [Hyphomicrobiaceae bacterium]